MFRGWLGCNLGTLLVGLAVTLAGAFASSLSIVQRVENLLLDAHFALVNDIEASPDIVHIDIDDDSLELAGSWPWRRDVQAALVDVPRQLGAKAIVVDLVFPEPRAPEMHLPGVTPVTDLDAIVAQADAANAENVVLPDEVLAATIRDAGNVYLSSYFRPARERTGVERAVVEAFRKDVADGVNSIVASLRLTDEQAARVPFIALRREAIASRVAELLETDPDAGAQTVYERLVAEENRAHDAVRSEIIYAWESVQSLRVLERRLPPVPTGLAARVEHVKDLTAPLFLFSRSARGTGFVSFDPDPVDGGTLRRLPLLAEYRGHLIKQLAFEVYCRENGIADADLSIDAGGWLRIAPGPNRPALRIHLDARQKMLVNWHRGDGSWRDSFVHIPAAKILEVSEPRRLIRENEQLRDQWLADVMRLAKGGAAYEGYSKEVNAYLADRRAVYWAELQGRGPTPETDAIRQRRDARRAMIQQDQEATIDFVRQAWEQLQSAELKTPEEKEEYARFKNAADILAKLPAVDAANADLDAQATAAADRIRSLIAGKTCFVGYTATAVADMVDVPIYPRTPGVMVHSNLYNTFVQQRFLRSAVPWQRFAFILVLGGLVTRISAPWDPRRALYVVIAAIVVLAAFNAFVLFAQWRFWMPVLTPAATAFATWAMVVMYRFLVTERARRQFSKALAQYTSPAIARQIAEKADKIDLSPVASEVTCFFSDLANFTTISEKHLDPAKTRHVLNPYLEAMSHALTKRSALINKFIGDGIFAFFNPPIFPCSQHARSACEAALACQAALADLIERQKSDPLAHVFAMLQMRIGVASGPVFVGDFGSENKLDYTCMGDTVNLAARLEPANKFFGTRMIVSGATHDAAGNGLVYRRLGALQVKGKAIAVPVYELMGLQGEVPAADVQFAERFSAAVDLFQARRWADARSAFTELASQRAADLAVQRYIERVAVYESASPPDDWNGAIELAEK